MARVTETTRVKKSKNVHWKSVDGEAVLLHFGTGNYFALDPVGTFLWSSICEQPKTVKNLVDSMILEYACTQETAKKDALEFCGQLLAEKLLEFQE